MDERTLRARMLLGESAMDRLRKSHVAVFGLGGVGSWCAEALARSGVGRMTLVDQDTVSVSNINRQLCALESTVGMPKAEVVARRLRDINPQIKINCIAGRYEAADRERFLADYDYVVDAIDIVSCKLDLIITCLERGIPIISALGTGNKRDAGLLRIDDISKTSNCALARVMRKALRDRGLSSLKVVFSDEPPRKAPGGTERIVGSVSFVPAAAGLAMASAIVRDLCGFPDAQLFTGNDFRD